MSKYNRRAELQSQQGGLSDGYPTEPTWTTVKKLWVSKRDLSGREYFQAAAVNAEDTTEFKTRYQNNISSEQRLVLDGLVYDIQSVLDADGTKKEWTIMAKAVVDGG